MNRSIGGSSCCFSAAVLASRCACATMTAAPGAPCRRPELTASQEELIMAADRVEVVFSFDTTGSMYPCLTQVRRKVKSTVTRLAEEIDGIRIGIIAHGDYCDKGSTYVTKHLDLTDNVDKIC